MVLCIDILQKEGANLHFFLEGSGILLLIENSECGPGGHATDPGLEGASLAGIVLQRPHKHRTALSKWCPDINSVAW